MLINKHLAGRSTATQFGQVSFDAKGVAQNLTEEQESVFKGVRGFVFTSKVKPVTEESEASEGTGEKVSLDSLTIAELKKFAKEHSIKVPTTVTKKADIKNLILNEATKGE